MIVNIRGTSGSGKSTIVRRVMDIIAHGMVELEPVTVEGRKRPIMYRANGAGPMRRSLSILGHYETACGGCDTIPSFDRVYELVRQEADQGRDVLFEGLLLSAEIARCQALHDDLYPLVVVAIDLPVEQCIESVNARRQAKSPGKGPVNPKNTEAKHRQTRRAVERLAAGGVLTKLVSSRDSALEEVIRSLGLRPYA